MIEQGTYEAHQLINKCLVLKSDYEVMVEETVKITEHESLSAIELKEHHQHIKSSSEQVTRLYNEVTQEENIPEALVRVVDTLWEFHLNFIKTRVDDKSILKEHHINNLKQYQTTMNLIAKEIK